MFEYGELYYSDVNWCAGTKVSLISSELQDMINNGFSIDGLEEYISEVDGSSCTVVSANFEEIELLEWLKVNGFKKGPTIENYGHSCRKTWMFFKQIPKSIWKKYNKVGQWA